MAAPRPARRCLRPVSRRASAQARPRMTVPVPGVAGGRRHARTGRATPRPRKASRFRRLQPRPPVACVLQLGPHIRVWPIEGGACQTLRGHTDEVLAAAFHPDGRRLATCCTSLPTASLTGRLPPPKDHRRAPRPRRANGRLARRPASAGRRRERPGGSIGGGPRIAVEIPVRQARKERRKSGLHDLVRNGRRILGPHVRGQIEPPPLGAHHVGICFAFFFIVRRMLFWITTRG
jgi:hypothetical protein